MYLCIDTRYIESIDVKFSSSLLVLIVTVGACEFKAFHTKRSICITLNVIMYLYMYITLYTYL